MLQALEKFKKCHFTIEIYGGRKDTGFETLKGIKMERQGDIHEY